MMDESLLQDFIVETSEHLEEIEKNLLKLSSGQEDSELLNDIFRSIHTIKGSSEYLGMSRTAELSHRIENLLDRMRQKIISIDDKVIDTLIAGTDRIALLIEQLGHDGGEKSNIDDLLKLISDFEDPTRSNTESATKTDTTSEQIIEVSEIKPDTKKIRSNVTYDEEYDTELFDIFIEQLKEGLGFLKRLSHDDIQEESQTELRKKYFIEIKKLQNSANYMGYVELSELYTQWISDTEKIDSIDSLYTMEQVEIVSAMFPKLKSSDEMIPEDNESVLDSFENDIRNTGCDTKNQDKLKLQKSDDVEFENENDIKILENEEDSESSIKNQELSENSYNSSNNIPENECEHVDYDINFTLDLDEDDISEDTVIEESLLDDFIVETSEHLDEIESNLIQLSSSQEDKNKLNDIFRSIHTIKGSSEYLGMSRIAELSHQMESMLDQIKSNDIKISDGIIEALIAGRDRIKLLIDEIGQFGVEKSNIDDVSNKIEILSKASNNKAKDQKDTIIEESHISDNLSTSDIDEVEEDSFSETDIVYEEDNDLELYEIFIEQVNESLTILKNHLINITNNSSLGATIQKCFDILESLKKSAHYMGYEHLEAFYEKWANELEKDEFNADIGSFEKMASLQFVEKVKNIAAMFPKSVTLIDLIADMDFDRNATIDAEDDEIIDLINKVDQSPGSAESSGTDNVSSLKNDNTSDIAEEEDKDNDLNNSEITHAESLLFPEDIDFEDNESLMDDNFETEILEDISNQDDELIELSEIVSENYFNDDQENSIQATELIEKLEESFDSNLVSENEDENSEIIENALFSSRDNQLSDKDISDQYTSQDNDNQDEQNTQSFVETELDDEDSDNTDSSESVQTNFEDEKNLEDSTIILDDDKTSITYSKEMLDALRAEFDINNFKRNTISSTSQSENKENEKSVKKIADLSSTENVNERSTEKHSTQSVRVDAGKIDALMNQIGELVVNRAFFSQLNNEMKLFEQFLRKNSDFNKMELKQLNGLTNRLSEATLSLGRVATDLQEKVMRVRMLPISQLFNRYFRLVHDLVKGKNKKVKLEVFGEDTELDRMVIEKIADPLVHIIRNSIDHGIEDAADRLNSGKPAVGKLHLEAYHESNHVVIKIVDDGKGIDLERIRNRALEKNLLTKEEIERISNKELTSMIMQPGFSTASEVTHTSGRGVGMDVVKKNVEKLNGTIEVESEFAVYTEIRIKIPLTLAIIPALLVRVSDDIFTIPLSNVDETIRVFKHEITKLEGIEVIQLRDENIPMLRLTEVFNIDPLAKTEKDFVVIVKIGDTRVGLIVDELLGDEEIVIKPLEDYLQEKTGFSGATILGDGNISLILDVYELVNLCKEKQTRRNTLNSVL